MDFSFLLDEISEFYKYSRDEVLNLSVKVFFQHERNMRIIQARKNIERLEIADNHIFFKYSKKENWIEKYNFYSEEASKAVRVNKNYYENIANKCEIEKLKSLKAHLERKRGGKIVK